MTQTVILLIEVALVVAVLAAAVVHRVRETRTAVRRRVLVNLIGGQAIDGVLWARRGRMLILRDAKLLEQGVEPVPMDGEVIIDRQQIDFVQARY
ncbi:hypothetical protein ACFQE5_01795 [Pseudonocardia hispaniensis]|uniref:Flagellar protein FliO/FliZ n=1 Tax=Pseudonocardia hispaniensis TaxID=904933 RepID=A0ABW1IWZ1_9PSEU